MADYASVQVRASQWWRTAALAAALFLLIALAGPARAARVISVDEAWSGSVTVAENVALGLPSSRGILTDLDKVSERILELAEIRAKLVAIGLIDA